MRLGLVLSALAIATGLVGCGEITPATLEYVSASPAQPRVGETTIVTFRALDERGNPAPGVTVHFSLQTADPGVHLTPESGTTDKTNGQVSVAVISTTRVAGAQVLASAGDPKVGVTYGISAPLSFSGGAPNARQFTFQCGEVSGAASGGIHAIQAWDETRHLIAGVKLNCSAHVGDNNGDGIPGASVSFLTEAGTIGPTSTSVTDVVGNATILYKTSFPFPVATDPITVNVISPDAPDLTHLGGVPVPMWLNPFDWQARPVLDYQRPVPKGIEPSRLDPITTVTTFNPRDNLVSLIAVTAGEEGFTDLNDNGQWDNNEPFDDTTEPFVDSNDNGTWDPGERYVDTNGDGSWTGRNKTYDKSTLLWASEKILWTGVAHEWDVKDTTNPIFAVLGNGVTIPHFGSSGLLTILISDPWFNHMAADVGGDSCGLPESGGSVVKVVPSSIQIGIPPSYPAPGKIEFNINDAHDPSVQPLPPPFAPPLGFSIKLGCTFTGSPIDGFKLLYTIPEAIVGTVE